MERRFIRVFVAVVLLALGGCREVLFSRLTEAQANEVLAALSQGRIDATKARIENDVWQIEVDSARVGPALVYLKGRGVPAHQGPALGEVFKKDGLISSPMEERARYASALQDSIATTLRHIDGISDARVHVAIPQNDPLSQRVVPASAAIFIKHLPSLDVEMLTPNLKALVMASVEGLDYRNITLVAVRSEASPALPAPTRTASFLDAQAAAAFPAPASTGMHSDDSNSGGSGQALAAAGAGLAGFATVGAVAFFGYRRRKLEPFEHPRSVPHQRLDNTEPAHTNAHPEGDQVPVPGVPPGMFGTLFASPTRRDG